MLTSYFSFLLYSLTLFLSPPIHMYIYICQRNADVEAAEEEIRETARAAQMIARKVADAAAGLSLSILPSLSLDISLSISISTSRLVTLILYFPLL
jgi:hypothetical protein